MFGVRHPRSRSLSTTVAVRCTRFWVIHCNLLHYFAAALDRYVNGLRRDDWRN
jgi:hypothetical protein